MTDKTRSPSLSVSYRNSSSNEQINGRTSSISYEWTKSTETDYLFASRLVNDAKDLRNFEYQKTKTHLSRYEAFLRQEFSWFINFTILVNLLLALIEEPSDIKVPYWFPCLIEIICLIVYLIRWLHLYSFQTPKSFINDKKNWVSLITIILIFFDIIAFLLAHHFQARNIHRYTRCLRVLIYINFNEGRELRRVFRNVKKTIPDIFNVYALYLISMLMFSFLAWRMLKIKKLFYSNNLPYFNNFEDSFTDLYVLVTTANFPDVMMPIYDVNSLYAIFFIVFLIINLYVFMNIILATIYMNYKKHLKEEVRSTIVLKREKIKEAFKFMHDVLWDLGNKYPEKYEFKQTEFIRSNHEPVITYEKFHKLLKKVNESLPENHIKIIFHLLDADENNLLSFKEFVYLPDLLNYPITEIKDRMNIFEKKFPKIYNSRLSSIVKRLVHHRIFQLFFDFAIGMNILFIILDAEEGYEWAFLSFFIIEVLMRIYACGFKNFMSISWNIFDLIVVISGLIAGIIDHIEEGQSDQKNSFFEVILILRVLRLIKLLGSIKRFRVIIDTVGIIIPSLVTYALLVFTVFYVFSMIGLELFGSKIKNQYYNYTLSSSQISETYNCQNDLLTNTDFSRNKYCKNNFSTFSQSLVLLFELMVVNQWHVLTRGFEDATQTKWSRLYFFAFHISCVIITLNIFTAFIIEAFLLEYESHSKTSSDTKLEKRIIDLGYNADSDKKLKAEDPNESIFTRVYKSLLSIFVYDSKVPTVADLSKGLRFHINSKEPKKVEILLQRMFSTEFDIAEEDLINPVDRRS